MKPPLVSIIIPCYNAESFIGDAIHSALIQEYQRTEVIVVDDGSTDGTLDVIRSFGDSVKYCAGRNRGPAAARNTGVCASRGELLQFLDADDILYRSKLLRQVPVSVRNKPGLVFCDADVIDMDGGEYRGRWVTGGPTINDAVVHALHVVIQTSAPLHWREIFNKVGGFRVHTPPCDDRDLHLRLACAGVTFQHLPECLYVLRRVSGSLTKKDPAQGVQIQRSIGEDAYTRLLAAGNITDRRLEAFATYFATTGRCALRVGLRSLGQECFARAKQLHPNGGLPEAYSQTGQVLVRLAGPFITERLSHIKRRVCGNRELA